MYTERQVDRGVCIQRGRYVYREVGRQRQIDTYNTMAIK